MGPGSGPSNPADEIGARPRPGGGASFRVWAPFAKRVSVVPAGAGRGRPIPLRRSGSGYFDGAAEGLRAGDRYYYELDGKERYPDPASRFQPLGVHGPSEIVDPDRFAWPDDGWLGRPLNDMIIYELHVGTFTREGTFRAAAARLDDLRELGVTAVELMPVAQFPGQRNWGYDGVFPFAPQNSYGGPGGFRSLVRACHRRGLAVILDVVYNHLGPEGNYLGKYGPYFAGPCRTPWGPAVNLSEPWSDEVRAYFIANARHWIREHHIDGLRIDALHRFYDPSARPFLQELAESAHRLGRELGRQILVVGESDLNDTRLITPVEEGGLGFDAVWNDDFHHSVHAVLTGERAGYYQDFGGLGPIVRAFRDGFVYSGQYSRFRKRRRGNSSAGRPGHQFVIFSQDHDQVGNRPAGDRLSRTLPLGRLKLAAGLVLLSPFVPLLFMGEEYAESAPFQYFVSFGDAQLAEAVRAGRRAEIGLAASEAPAADPQGERAFLRSKLRWKTRASGRHRALLAFYRRLIHLRRSHPALRSLSKETMEVKRIGSVLLLRRWRDRDEILCLFNLGPRPRKVRAPLRARRWSKVLTSNPRTRPGEAAPRSITLAPWSLAIYESPGRSGPGPRKAQP